MRADFPMSRLEDEAAIRRLQARYADICSRRAFEELPEVIAANAPICLDLRGRSLEFTGPSELGLFIEDSIGVFDFFQFVIRNLVIDFDRGDGHVNAVSRLWMSELRHHRDSGEWSTIFGVYHDRYESRGGDWRICSRRYHSLARIAHALEDCVVFEFPEGEGALGEDSAR